MIGPHFQRHGQRVRATFEPGEIVLLRDLRDQLRATLESGDPAEPIVARLFPTAVLGDEEADEELRGYLRAELLPVRLEGLDALVAVLDRAQRHRGRMRVDLDDDEPMLVLGVLNDVRLAIGARIEVEALDRSAVSPDDDVAYPLAVMDHLAWMQEQLIAILDPSAFDHLEEGDEDAR